MSAPSSCPRGFDRFFLLRRFGAVSSFPCPSPLSLGAVEPPTAFPPNIWHAHEMAFGYGGAVVAGFLLTAIPNWTGRLPLQGGPLGALVVLWFCGRLAVLFSSIIGLGASAVVDLAFPAAFLAVVAREIVAGRNWRNLPMVGALALLLIGNALTHSDALGFASVDGVGNRLGVATLLVLVSLIGGRIVPSFTRNWLVKQDPNTATPAQFDLVDRIALATTVIALLAWAFAPESGSTPWFELAAGGALAARLARWRGEKTLPEPLLWVLHLGYGWLSIGLLLLGLNGLTRAAAADERPPRAHGRGHRDYDARRDDARVARPYRTRARRRRAHDGDLCHDHARCPVAPVRAVARRALCSWRCRFRPSRGAGLSVDSRCSTFGR